MNPNLRPMAAVHTLFRVVIGVALAHVLLSSPAIRSGAHFAGSGPFPALPFSVEDDDTPVIIAANAAAYIPPTSDHAVDAPLRSWCDPRSEDPLHEVPHQPPRG